MGEFGRAEPTVEGERGGEGRAVERSRINVGDEFARVTIDGGDARRDFGRKI